MYVRAVGGGAYAECVEMCYSAEDVRVYLTCLCVRSIRVINLAPRLGSHVGSPLYCITQLPTVSWGMVRKVQGPSTYAHKRLLYSYESKSHLPVVRSTYFARIYLSELTALQNKVIHYSIYL